MRVARLVFFMVLIAVTSFTMCDELTLDKIGVIGSNNNTAILPVKQTGSDAILPIKQTGDFVILPVKFTGNSVILPHKQTGGDAILPKTFTGKDVILPTIAAGSFDNNKFLGMQDLVNKIANGELNNMTENIQQQFNITSLPNLPGSVDVNAIINKAASESKISNNKTGLPDYMKPKNLNKDQPTENKVETLDIVPMNNRNDTNSTESIQGTNLTNPDFIVVIFNQTGNETDFTNSSAIPNVSSGNVNDNFGAIVNGSNLNFAFNENNTFNLTIIAQDKIESANIAVERNQIFNFTVEGNPTTGYQWYVIKNDPEKILTFNNLNEFNTTNDYIPANNMPGSNGLYYFNVKAANNGTVPVSFIYKRAWDDEPAFNFTIYTSVN